MGLFDFGKAKPAAKGAEANAKLDKDIDGVLKDLKRKRADKCQNMGMGVAKIGQDFSYIEKRTREYYTSAIQEIKSGKAQGQVYSEFLNSAATDADRDIVQRMFSLK